ncbi:MAG TPA: 2-phospho-L-lactate transferase [Steroidobacteraceae bacterium]|nr:2-phospho-L-lactate transferase [Steroidobacteraceae bacterium]
MSSPAVIAISGGIGGAKLALGLYRTLPAGTVTVIVNTGDDFDHLGLRICPDVDTTLYTLAGLANPELGWGRKDETWTFMRVLESLGGESWFQLGDGDLALHVERTRRLAAGERLSSFVADVARRFGISADIVPMSDDPVRTRVGTADGTLDFQDYFVRARCEPRVTSLDFAGALAARPTLGADAACRAASLEAIVICPSNPYLSIDPILAVGGMRELLDAASAPIIAVTPIVAGRAIKGPTAKIMRELGVPLTPLSVLRHYGTLLDGFVLDERDRNDSSAFECPLLITDTVMKTLEDRERLAREVIEFAASLRGRRAART